MREKWGLWLIATAPVHAILRRQIARILWMTIAVKIVPEIERCRPEDTD